MENQIVYRFGSFRLDPARRIFQYGDESLALPLKSFKCLTYLIEHRDRVVSRDEMLEEIWGTQHLSDGVVAQTILGIRRALSDICSEQGHIETVRGFGYRWVAPLEVEESEQSGEKPAAAEPVTAQTRRVFAWSWTRVAGVCLLAIVVLAAGALFYSRTAPDAAGVQAESGAAMLLPVVVEGGSDHAWIRLGVMEYMTEHLRAHGQAMVPGDTVIALLQGRSGEIDRRELDRITEATGAGMVVAAHARIDGDHWRVELNTLKGAEPPLSLFAEDDDVLEAAHAVAGRMASRLGLVPMTDTAVDPELRTLLQQVEAARMAQDTELMRELIAGAPSRLRGHPRLRFRAAQVELIENRFDETQSAFEALLDEPEVADDPILKGRILLALGDISHAHFDPDAWADQLAQATETLSQVPDSREMGMVHLQWAALTRIRRNRDAARMHLGDARRVLEASGDLHSLARMESEFGLTEFLFGNHAKAARFFESAAEKYRTLGNEEEELPNRTHILYASSVLLDPQLGLDTLPRVQELLARSSSTEMRVYSNIGRIYLLVALGRLNDAGQLLDELAEIDFGLSYLESMFARLRASWELSIKGNFGQAAQYAASVLREPSKLNSQRTEVNALLILVRAHLALGDLDAAAEVLESFKRWVEETEPEERAALWGLYTTLAEAELAVARRNFEAADTAFKKALDMVKYHGVPIDLLRVAESYLPWLLDHADGNQDKVRHALFITELLSEYADRHYDAALLQLRTYQTLGPESAWRRALERAESLAGEREIPEELRIAPAH